MRALFALLVSSACVAACSHPERPTGSKPAAAAASARAGAATLRLLFVGNSYTYVNELPQVLRRIGATATSGPVFEVESITQGGAPLRLHWESGAVPTTLAQRSFTHVILQGQSVEPVNAREGFLRHAQLLAQRAREAGATPVLYETWARAPGSPDYAQPWTLGSPAAMQDALRAAYTTAASEARGLLVPVGEAFRASLAARPALTLHQADGSHPTMAGTYLAASVFYVRLVGLHVPAGSEVPDGVSAPDAAFLRDIAAAAAP